MRHFMLRVSAVVLSLVACSAIPSRASQASLAPASTPDLAAVQAAATSAPAALKAPLAGAAPAAEVPAQPPTLGDIDFFVDGNGKIQITNHGKVFLNGCITGTDSSTCCASGATGCNCFTCTNGGCGGSQCFTLGCSRALAMLCVQ